MSRYNYNRRAAPNPTPSRPGRAGPRMHNPGNSNKAPRFADPNPSPTHKPIRPIRPARYPVKHPSKPVPDPFGKFPNELKKQPWRKSRKFLKGLGRRLPWIGLGLGAIELLEDFPWHANDPVGLGAAGFTLCCRIPMPLQAYQDVANTATLCSPSVNCGLALQVTDGAIANGIGPLQNRTVFLGPYNAAGTRMTHAEKWYRRTSPAPAPQTFWYRPGYQVEPTPFPYPGVWPETLPIQQPAPTPLPVPYPLLPYTPQTTAPETRRKNVPGQALKPYETPATETVIRPGRKKTKDPRGKHVKKKPRKKTKEKKTNSKLLRAIFPLANLVTESMDVVEAFYDALPWKLTQWKGRDGKWRDHDITMQGKLMRIYRNFDQIDINKLVDNLIENMIQDRLLGKLSSGAEKALNRLTPRRPVGAGTGPVL